MPVADPIYLDNNATAPLRAEAVAAIHQAMGPPANPSSVHGFGRRARLLVEDARQSLGLLIGCRAQDVVFTSGGTEANNLALSGFSHVITSAIEHDSVLQAAPQASLLPVTDDGLVDLAALKQMVAALPADQRDQTIVSVMAANNETGVIQPLAGIVEIARDAGLATHSDMVQLLGKTHIDLAALGLDFASFSAHKIGGPTGVGALVVRPGMRLTSLLRGGGQEQGRRSGTENILGITGFGAAATAAFGDVAHFRDMAGWRDAFEAEVAAARPDVALFGAAAPRLGNTSCLAVGGKSSETLVMALDIAGVAVSAGSACSSGKVTASHVLTAMRAGEKAAQAIRVSGGWQTRKEDFERLAQVLAGL
ncbi:MAG: cysteine desulfurase family protein [Alphaproteobacteria bacterium]|jgi:cysteine desulfurase